MPSRAAWRQRGEQKTPRRGPGRAATTPSQSASEERSAADAQAAPTQIAPMPVRPRPGLRVTTNIARRIRPARNRAEHRTSHLRDKRHKRRSGLRHPNAVARSTPLGHAPAFGGCPHRMVVGSHHQVLPPNACSLCAALNEHDALHEMELPRRECATQPQARTPTRCTTWEAYIRQPDLRIAPEINLERMTGMFRAVFWHSPRAARGCVHHELCVLQASELKEVGPIPGDNT